MFYELSSEDIESFKYNIFHQAIPRTASRSLTDNLLKSIPNSMGVLDFPANRIANNFSQGILPPYLPLKLPGEVAKEYSKIRLMNKDKVLYFHGHEVLGIAEILQLPQLYFTVIRDPINRFLSNFCWLSWNELGSNVNRGEHLRRYISFFEHHNFYCYYLSQPRWQFPLSDHFSNIFDITSLRLSDPLACVKKEIKQKFFLVGTTEKIYETVILLAYMFKLNTLYPIKRDIFTIKGINRESLPEDLLVELQEKTYLDNLLFKEVSVMVDILIKRYGLEDIVQRYKEKCLLENNKTKYVVLKMNW